MERFRPWIRNLLLAFVFVSVGYSLGRHSVRRDGGSADLPKETASGSYVEVIYLHATFRCVTCNTIERMTKEIVDTRFKTDVESGRIVWREANFQDDDALAKQFEVSASCVVVAMVRGGNVVDYKRLDDVWTWVGNQEKFYEYVGTAIADELRKLESDSGGKEEP
jgi:hypothetical protein